MIPPPTTTTRALDGMEGEEEGEEREGAVEVRWRRDGEERGKKEGGEGVWHTQRERDLKGRVRIVARTIETSILIWSVPEFRFLSQNSLSLSLPPQIQHRDEISTEF